MEIYLLLRLGKRRYRKDDALQAAGSKTKGMLIITTHGHKKR